VRWPFNGMKETYCDGCLQEYEAGALEIDAHEARVGAEGLPSSVCPRPEVTRVAARNDAPAIARALIEAVETMRALVDHADAMEAQNADYHQLAEGGIPCRSAPLNDARAFLAKHDGERE